MKNSPSDAGKHASSLLATFLVMLLGCIGALAIVFSMSIDATIPTAVVVGVMVCLSLISGLLQIAPLSFLRSVASVLLASHSNPDPSSLYRPKLKKPIDPIPLGGREPPSAESVRELAQLNVQWVPKGAYVERAKKQKRDRPSAGDGLVG